MSDSVYRYKLDPHRDDAVIAKLQEAVERYPAYGFSKLFKMLRRWGHPWNHKRVYRLYCELKLNKRRRGKKRLPTRSPEPLAVPAMANQCWSMDFMSDSLFCSRRFRTFNVVDDFNREALAIEIDLNQRRGRDLLEEHAIRIDQEMMVWPGHTMRNVREDHIHLYGFATREEKQAFELLIKVNGVGTRMALAILSALTPSQMAVAIAAQDKKAFTVANGVGPKLATRLITELKDKFTIDSIGDVDNFSASGVTTTTGSALEPTAVNDAIAALVSLGYGRSDAYQMIHRIAAQNDNMPVDDLIREALKQLSS